MEEYFKRAKIDNPLNIKRVTGDIPTTKSSSKNVGILLVSFLIMALTFNQVWSFTLFYLKSVWFSAILLGIIYTLISLKILSISVFEEKKQKKAYRDLLENKMSDLSVIWEIQDIKETEVNGEPIAYIDYINGQRSVLVRCVPGSIMNKDEDAPRYFYNTIQSALEFIDNAEYQWDLHVDEESIGDDKALNYYYSTLKDYEDEDFIEIFTEILDTIKYVGETRSAIHVVYIEIIGTGGQKTNMFSKLTPVIDALSKGTIFKEVDFVRTKINIDRWIAHKNGVSMFDREELIMNKYRNSYNLGVTSVLAAYDNEGNMTKKFNPDFDPARIVRKKSIDLSSNQIRPVQQNALTEETITKIRDKGITMEGSEGEIKIEELQDTKHKKFIELMYSKDKVKLG